MIKTVMPTVCVFDAEFVPCVDTIKRVYGVDGDTAGLLDHAYRQADPEWKWGQPKPMLKSFLYRVVSVSCVWRSEKTGAVTLSLRSLAGSEAAMLEKFFKGVGSSKAQLVGFASRLFDLPVMAQRALLHGLSVPEFFDRPAKPWEGPDYLQRNCDWSVDLLDDLAGGGDHKARPKLDHIAKACGVPGKLGMCGEDVEAAWYGGSRREVEEYNDFDACTTHLLWARMAAMSGLLDYEREAAMLEGVLRQGAKERPHFKRFLEEWRRP